MTATLHVLRQAQEVADVGDGVVIPIQLLTLIVGTLLPVVVGFVTKSNASERTKAIVALVAAAVATVTMRALDDGTDLVVDSALIGEFLTLVITTVATYLGWWKPVLNVNARLAPRFGIGGSATEREAA